ARAARAATVARGEDRRHAMDGRLLRVQLRLGSAPLMCGIAGTHGFGDAALIRAMTDTLIYRGPDGEGFYVGDGVCLGNRRLAIASEAKAVLASGIVGAELDEASLHLSMNVRYVPGARTLFRGIRRLSPGHVLEVTDHEAPREYAYTSIDWTPDETRTRAEWLDGIRSHYEQAVTRQLLSDVPLGVSLSGGIDSSSVVAMVRRAHGGSIKTFTLGFDEPQDEL